MKFYPKNNRRQTHIDLNEDPPPGKRYPRIFTAKPPKDLTPNQEIAMRMLYSIIEDFDIEDQFKDIKKYRTYKRYFTKKDYDSALDYINSNNQDYPLSFDNICYVLNIDPDRTRTILREKSNP